MKPGSLLRRVTSRDAKGRSMGNKELKAENGSVSVPLIGRHDAMKTPTKEKYHVETKNRKPEKTGGSIFWRIMNRNKKAIVIALPLKTPSRLLATPERRLTASTPVTIDTDMGAEIEVPLTIPCERVPSFADTTLTHEISDFSAQADEGCEKPEKKNSFKRSSSARPSPRALNLGSSALEFRSSRSLRNFRKSGNESVGESKPEQPRRNFLPPLLADGEESIGESSCSGITMDFTYGDERKVPMRQPVGRLGEGARHGAPKSFVPPSYITMDYRDEMDEEGLGGLTYF
eukprot:scaffold2093_cov161-Amphora_coffeaeformis.AAC.6